MELGSKFEKEPFDPAKYWKDKMERLTSSEMSEASKRRAKLFVAASERIHGKPPSLTSSMIDTLMDGYPTDREIELWIDSSSPKEIQTVKSEPARQTHGGTTKPSLAGETSKVIQTQPDELLNQIKRAADVFEQHGGRGRYGGDD